MKRMMRVRDICKQAQFPIRDAEAMAHNAGIVLRGAEGSRYVTTADAKKLFPLLQEEATRRRNQRRPPKARNQKFNQVYFIRCGEFVKIGFTYDVLVRLETLQAATPYTLELLDSFAGGESDEKELHARFAEHRVRGEWFHLAPEIMNHIDLRRARRAESPVKSPDEAEFYDEIRSALETGTTVYSIT
ncbi:GIY-YIG nuclease family protein [Nitrobacter sp.]|uniref:GIY-YIG nuclease family protein n=1 Tax=Nitrobacter sp. TaxID=29420 RepID=UPI003F65160C